MLIKNARIYGQEQSDIRIENGLIKELGTLKALPNEEVFEANNLTCLPSFIDLNVRLKNDSFSLANLKLLEDECLKGGIGAIMLRDSMDFDEHSFALFLEHLKSLKIKVFASVKVCDDEGKLKNLSMLLNEGAFALELHSSVNANILRQSMQYALMKGVSVFVNCYDEDFDDKGVMNDSALSFEQGLVGISAIGESSEVAKMQELKHYYGVNIVYDMISLARSLALIHGVNMAYDLFFGDEPYFKISHSDNLIQVGIHHLLKSDEACKDFNTLAKFMPPLRDEKDRLALNEALKKGQIRFLSAAHSPKSLTLKDLAFDEAAFGIHSLHEYLSLCYTFFVKNGFLTWKELCKYTSLNQAQFLGLNSGEIAPNKQANLLFFDEGAKCKVPEASLYAKDELFGQLKAHYIAEKLIQF